MNELKFFVPGIPAPGGSKHAFGLKKGGVYTGRFVIVDAAGQKNKNWRASVGQAAADMVTASLAEDPRQSPFPIPGALELELIFQMPRPKSHFRSNGIELKPGSPSRHIIAPDVLKLTRATEDAMKGICYRDDSQIVKETLEKVYSDKPGAWIVIREL